MPFRNPTTTLPADAITPGTMTGSVVQTGESGARVVLHPEPDSDTGTQSPAVLFYSGIPLEDRPGSLSADVFGEPGDVSSPQITLKAPNAVEFKSQPQFYLKGARVHNSTGAEEGQGAVWGLELEGGDPQDGRAAFYGYSGTVGTNNSAYIQLSVSDSGTASAPTSARLEIGHGKTVVSQPLHLGSLSFGVQQWVTPSRAAGWGVAGAPWVAPRYRKMADGTVRLSGITTPPSGSPSTTVLFTLPEGYRPDQAYHGDSRCNSGATFSSCAIQITTDGLVTLTNFSGTISFVSFDGVSFTTN